jgi:hypothetical protein
MRSVFLAIVLSLPALVSSRGIEADGRQTWISTGPPGFAVAVAVDPSDSSVVYSATAAYSPSGLTSSAFRSTTGGRGWEEIGRAPANSRVMGFIVDPTSPSTLYAATAAVANGNVAPPCDVYRSTDRGTTWILVKTFASDVLGALAGDPLSPGTLYAGGWTSACSPAPCARGALYRSPDRGDSWSEVDSGLSGSVGSLVIDPIRPRGLYAGTSDGVFRSNDGGASWQPSSSGLERCSTVVTALAIDPRDPFVLFAGVYKAAFNDVGCMGVFKSVNGGATWESTDSPRIHVSSLAVDPTNSSVVYASAQNGGYFFSPPPGVFRSWDGGVTWTQLTAGLRPYFGVYALAVDSSGTLVHAATDSGVFEYRLWPDRPSPLTVPFRN